MIGGVCSYVFSYAYNFKLISSFLLHQGKNKPFVEGLHLFGIEFWEGWETRVYFYFSTWRYLSSLTKNSLRMLSLSLPIGFYGAKMYHACFWRRKEIIGLIQPSTLWTTKISYRWNIGTNPMRVPLSDSIEKRCQKMKPIYNIVLEFRNLYLDFSYYRLVQPTNLLRKTFFIIQGL